MCPTLGQDTLNRSLNKALNNEEKVIPQKKIGSFYQKEEEWIQGGTPKSTNVH